MTTIQLRRNTAAQAAADNPVLAAGEPGVETDTGKIKIGDGVTAWNTLPYSTGGGSGLVPHKAAHAPGGTDALDYPLVNLTGTLAARPAAAAVNAGLIYLATDENGGTPYRSTGSAWTQLAKGVTASASAPANRPIYVTDYGVSPAAGTATITPAQAAANATNIQAALDACPRGGKVIFPAFSASGYTFYDTTKPLVTPEGVTVEGDSSGGNVDYGVTLRIHSSAVAADWNAQAVLTSANYFTGRTNGPATGSIVVRDLRFDGNQKTFGSGIILMNRNSRVLRCNFTEFRGSVRWAPTQATPAGSGYGVVMTGAFFISGQLNAECPEQKIMDCRFETTNSHIFSSDGAGVQITDSFLINNVFVKPPTYAASVAATVEIESAGGWLMEGNHWNVGTGVALQLNGAVNTRIVNNYFDSWGNINTPGQVVAAIQVQETFAQGGSAIVIAGNHFRWRKNTTAGVALVGTHIAIKVTAPDTAAAAGLRSTASIIGNTGFVEGGSTHTPVIFDLRGGATNSVILTVTLTGNAFVDSNGPTTRWNDAQVYRAGSLGTLVEVISEGNSWNSGDAAPTTGQWSQGMKRWNSSPIASGVPGWVCVTNATPTIWKNMAALSA